FQAEDGIRDRNVTGVQTCALPIWAYRVTVAQFADIAAQEMRREPAAGTALEQVLTAGFTGIRHRTGPGRYETLVHAGERDGLARSEERRVGKEGRWRWSGGR